MDNQPLIPLTIKSPQPVRSATCDAIKPHLPDGANVVFVCSGVEDSERKSELLPTTRLILSGNRPDSRQLGISSMERLFLFIVFLASIVWIEVADEDPHWRVAFYQNLNAGGLKTKLDVSTDGTSSVPISEFRKYHLEDQISEIRYTLPPGVFLVCFAGRFFSNDDGDIGNFLNNNKILRNAAVQDGVKMSNDVLLLEGSGSEQIVNLQALGWANRIRSAEVVKP